MAISIKSKEADELARQLAGLTKLSITDAVLKALREQLRRETGRFNAPRLKQELQAISDHCAALEDLDTRPAEGILGFDQHGLPQ